MILPRRISIEISTSCNLSCKMCFLTGFRNKNDFSLPDLNKFFDIDLFKKLANELAGNHLFYGKTSPFSVIFTGGEPLLHPKIFDLLGYAKTRNIGVTLFTNGTLIESLRPAKIIKAAPEAIMFSLEGPKEIHDQIRGKGNFERTHKAIKAIQLEKQAFNKEKPEIFINATINNLNFDYLQQLISIAGQLNINGLSFSHIQWSNQALSSLAENEFKKRLNWFSHSSRMIESVEHNLAIQKSNINKLIEQISLIKEKYKNSYLPRISFMPDLNPAEIRLWYLHQYHKINFCSSVYDWIRIGVNGDVQSICAVIPFPFGNLTNHSLSEILTGERIKEFINEIETNGFFYACQRCCRRPNQSYTL